MSEVVDKKAFSRIIKNGPVIFRGKGKRTIVARKSRRKGRVLLIAVGALALLGVSLVLYWSESRIFSSAKKIDKDRNTILTFPIHVHEDRSLLFQSFVIPVVENEQFTYLTLRVCFYLSNKELKEEMIRKKAQIRGIIYSILREETDRAKGLPFLETIKKLIIESVNRILSSGEIEETYVTQFLAV